MAYLDEASFNYQPFVRRTWAERGKTPSIAHGPLWGGVQAISLVTDTGRIYFKLKTGAFTGSDVVDFLAGVLRRYRRYGLLVILDGVRMHHSRAVQDFIAAHRQRIHLEYLPAYCPQLNADEQVHGFIKQYRMANRLLTQPQELWQAVRTAYGELARRPDLGRAFLPHPDVAYYQTSAA